MIQINKLEQKPKSFVDIITAFVHCDSILIFYYHQCGTVFCVVQYNGICIIMSIYILYLW